MKTVNNSRKVEEKRELDKKKVVIFGVIMFIVLMLITFVFTIVIPSMNLPSEIQSIVSSAENIDDLTTKIKSLCYENGLEYEIVKSEDKTSYTVAIKDGSDISKYTYKLKSLQSDLDVDESKLTDAQLKERKAKKTKICSDVSFALGNNKIIDTLVSDLKDIKKDSENEGISFEYEITDKLDGDYVLKTIVGGDIYRDSFKVKKIESNLNTTEVINSKSETLDSGEETQSSDEEISEN